MTKVLAVFCYLLIKMAKLASEIETHFFDLLICFGESGSLLLDYPWSLKEFVGKIEIQVMVIVMKIIAVEIMMVMIRC